MDLFTCCPDHSQVTGGHVSDDHTSVSSNIGVQMALDSFFPIKLCCFFKSACGAGHHQRGRSPRLLAVATSKPLPPSHSPSPHPSSSAGVMAELPSWNPCCRFDSCTPVPMASLWKWDADASFEKPCFLLLWSSLQCLQGDQGPWTQLSGGRFTAEQVSQ